MFHFSIGEFYHIYNRGVNKMPIFLDSSNNERFLKLLFACNNTKPVVFKTIQGLPLDKIEREETIVDIGAYCLMPNHFHILVKEKKENGISLFMEKLLTAYSMYFNKKNERLGNLFEGTFKASHANNDVYLKHLFAYIHLNPVKLIYPEWKEKGVPEIKKANDFLNNYKYSSYCDFKNSLLGVNFNRPESLILNKYSFPDYFSDFKEFDDYMEDWIESKNSKDYPWMLRTR